MQKQVSAKRGGFKAVSRVVSVVRMHVVTIVISGIAEPELFKSFCRHHVASLWCGRCGRRCMCMGNQTRLRLNPVASLMKTVVASFVSSDHSSTTVAI